jgi:hypothetical protein
MSHVDMIVIFTDYGGESFCRSFRRIKASDNEHFNNGYTNNGISTEGAPASLTRAPDAEFPEKMKSISVYHGKDYQTPFCLNSAQSL